MKTIAQTVALKLTSLPTRTRDDAVVHLVAARDAAGILPTEVSMNTMGGDRTALIATFADRSSLVAVPTPKGRKWNWHTC